MGRERREGKGERKGEGGEARVREREIGKEEGNKGLVILNMFT